MQFETAHSLQNERETNPNNDNELPLAHGHEPGSKDIVIVRFVHAGRFRFVVGEVEVKDGEGYLDNHYGKGIDGELAVPELPLLYVNLRIHASVAKLVDSIELPGKVIDFPPVLKIDIISYIGRIVELLGVISSVVVRIVVGVD